MVNAYSAHMHLVTGFISEINERADRHLAKYIALGKELLSVEIKTTCFLERTVFDQYIRPELTSPMSDIRSWCTFSYLICGHVTFVFFEKSDLFLWAYRELATQFYVNTGNPNKDTLEYMMVQCQKPEWVALAIQLSRSLDPFAVSEFAWIDFGVFHMFGGSVDTFQLSLYEWRNRVDKRVRKEGESSVIRIAGCWDPTLSYAQDIYRDICWVFAGSVFGGGEQRLERFAKCMRETCIRLLEERRSLMWEVNVWVLLYRKHPEWFSWYKSDHSRVLLDAYY